jgi:hypothetical protein
MRDLEILVADKDMEQAVEKTVRRAPSLGIRKIDFEIYRHPCRDNGCRTASLDVLRPLADKYQHALVLFDHEGCGAEHQFLDDVEAQVLHHLEINGWQDRAARHLTGLVPRAELVSAGGRCRGESWRGFPGGYGLEEKVENSRLSTGMPTLSKQITGASTLPPGKVQIRSSWQK